MEKQTKKLSLDAFKKMAEKVQKEEVMQKVEGGNLLDCHGTSGLLVKAVSNFIKNVF
ncbi:MULTISPECIES: hypothetical protein [unclassified Chryseobacterium]|uniref:hypothetical protein n=1 Tax=unclassified Chryseobacterium TaxID=2593645 RepID=UPI00288306C9|nr:hypothetical protein [Chryseobacterium sp. SG20098]WNI37304.1 hypothetical protein RHP76_02305 [Chryseobacterium sp. SG20098]